MHPAVVMFVAQGIGQNLHRVGAGHQVAVAVEPGMDLDEGELAVAQKNLEARLP